MYRSGSDKAQMGLVRQFLHSYHLRFDHPVTGDTVKLMDAPPPELQRVLDELAPRSLGRTEVGSMVFSQMDLAPRQAASLSLM